jgi:drug/metabolite transporter (DMT)-like permease
MTALEWSMLLTLSVLWGGSFFFVAVAVGELPPLTIVVLRVAIAAVALHLTLHVLGERLPTRPDVWAAFVVMGFLNTWSRSC